jgi:hypothetical protein
MSQRPSLPPYIINISDRVSTDPQVDRPHRCQCCRQFPEVDEKPRYALYRWSPKRRRRYSLGDICRDCLRKGPAHMRKIMRIMAHICEGDTKRLRDILHQGFELSPAAKRLEAQP